MVSRDRRDPLVRKETRYKILARVNTKDSVYKSLILLLAHISTFAKSRD